ncbi:NAD-P-binding protein [Cyathus striatus]|nr:NAD-P-binding protein [Cyathus striatus]
MSQNILESLNARNLFDLRGVVAVVTGGGSGIGLMISSTLVSNGATVYIIGPKQTDLDRIAKVYNDGAANKEGMGRMHGIEGDIRLKSEAKRLAEEIASYISHSRSIRLEPVDGVEQEDFDDVLKTNAVGPYWLTFAFLPLLEKWKNSEEAVTKKFVSQIVMTSSMNGWTKDSMTSGSSYPYLFSKSAIGHATSSLAHELLPLGIRVNGIAPGVFATEMAAPGTADEFGISHTSPDNRTNKDMGSLALFLVANWFVNGETVLIDGGTLLKHPSSY